MEALDHVRSDLLINYDSVVQSLKQLNRARNVTTSHNDSNGNLNNEENPESKPVDKEVQKQGNGNNRKMGEFSMQLIVKTILNRLRHK